MGSFENAFASGKWLLPRLIRGFADVGSKNGDEDGRKAQSRVEFLLRVFMVESRTKENLSALQLKPIHKYDTEREAKEDSRKF